MQLSKRLTAVSDMVSPGNVLADIGTDHAYIPIYLLETGRISRAIAADVNAGPLGRARQHIREHGLEQKIDTRLSDGLTAIAPGEVQSILIAGMGGALTIRILTAGAGVVDGCGELILQPQSEICLVRAYLERIGWEIRQEDMVFEEGKYYVVMRAMSAGTQASFADGGDPAAEPDSRGGALRAAGAFRTKMTDIELYFGPRLLEARHPVLREYLLYERAVQRRILGALRNGSGTSAAQREQEIRRKLEYIETALRMCEEPVAIH